MCVVFSLQNATFLALTGSLLIIWSYLCVITTHNMCHYYAQYGVLLLFTLAVKSFVQLFRHHNSFKENKSYYYVVDLIET